MISKDWLPPPAITAAMIPFEQRRSYSAEHKVIANLIKHGNLKSSLHEIITIILGPHLQRDINARRKFDSILLHAGCQGRH